MSPQDDTRAELLAAVEAVEGVVAASPYLDAEGMVRGAAGEIMAVRVRGVDPDRVFKTLVVETDTGELVVGIVPVTTSLNLKRIAKAVKANELSPTDAVQAYLERIDRLDSRLAAYITVVREEALAAARLVAQQIGRGEDPGPLAGVPIAVKDQYWTKGILTTNGSKVFQDFPGLRIIVAHGGGSVPYQIGRWRAARFNQMKGDPNLTDFDTALKQLYYDAVLYNKESLELLFKLVGTDRTMFGTENPGSGTATDPVDGHQLDDLAPVINSIEWLTDQDKKNIFEDVQKEVFPLLKA